MRNLVPDFLRLWGKDYPFSKLSQAAPDPRLIGLIEHLVQENNRLKHYHSTHEWKALSPLTPLDFSKTESSSYAQLLVPLVILYQISPFLNPNMTPQDGRDVLTCVLKTIQTYITFNLLEEKTPKITSLSYIEFPLMLAYLFASHKLEAPKDTEAYKKAISVVNPFVSIEPFTQKTIEDHFNPQTPTSLANSHTSIPLVPMLISMMNTIENPSVKNFDTMAERYSRYVTSILYEQSVFLLSFFSNNKKIEPQRKDVFSCILSPAIIAITRKIEYISFEEQSLSRPMTLESVNNYIIHMSEFLSLLADLEPDTLNPVDRLFLVNVLENLSLDTDRKNFLKKMPAHFEATQSLLNYIWDHLTLFRTHLIEGELHKQTLEAHTLYARLGLYFYQTKPDGVSRRTCASIFADKDPYQPLEEKPYLYPMKVRVINDSKFDETAFNQRKQIFPPLFRAIAQQLTVARAHLLKGSSSKILSDSEQDIEKLLLHFLNTVKAPQGSLLATFFPLQDKLIQLAKENFDETIIPEAASLALGVHDYCFGFVWECVLLIPLRAKLFQEILYLTDDWLKTLHAKSDLTPQEGNNILYLLYDCVNTPFSSAIQSRILSILKLLEKHYPQIQSLYNRNFQEKIQQNPLLKINMFNLVFYRIIGDYFKADADTTRLPISNYVTRLNPAKIASQKAFSDSPLFAHFYTDYINSICQSCLPLPILDNAPSPSTSLMHFWKTQPEQYAFPFGKNPASAHLPEESFRKLILFYDTLLTTSSTINAELTRISHFYTTNVWRSREPYSFGKSNPQLFSFFWGPAVILKFSHQLHPQMTPETRTDILKGLKQEFETQIFNLKSISEAPEHRAYMPIALAYIYLNDDIKPNKLNPIELKEFNSTLVKLQQIIKLHPAWTSQEDTYEEIIQFVHNLSDQYTSSFPLLNFIHQLKCFVSFRHVIGYYEKIVRTLTEEAFLSAETILLEAIKTYKNTEDKEVVDALKHIYGAINKIHCIKTLSEEMHITFDPLINAAFIGNLKEDATQLQDILNTVYSKLSLLTIPNMTPFEITLWAKFCALGLQKLHKFPPHPVRELGIAFLSGFQLSLMDAIEYNATPENTLRISRLGSFSSPTIPSLVHEYILSDKKLLRQAAKNHPLVESLVWEKNHPNLQTAFILLTMSKQVLKTDFLPPEEMVFYKELEYFYPSQNTPAFRRAKNTLQSDNGPDRLLAAYSEAVRLACHLTEPLSESNTAWVIWVLKQHFPATFSEDMPTLTSYSMAKLSSMGLPLKKHPYYSFQKDPFKHYDTLLEQTLLIKTMPQFYQTFFLAKTLLDQSPKLAFYYLSACLRFTQSKSEDFASQADLIHDLLATWAHQGERCAFLELNGEPSVAPPFRIDYPKQWVGTTLLANACLDNLAGIPPYSSSDLLGLSGALLLAVLEDVILPTLLCYYQQKRGQWILPASSNSEGPTWDPVNLRTKKAIKMAHANLEAWQKIIGDLEEKYQKPYTKFLPLPSLNTKQGASPEASKQDLNMKPITTTPPSTNDSNGSRKFEESPDNSQSPPNHSPEEACVSSEQKVPPLLIKPEPQISQKRIQTLQAKNTTLQAKNSSLQAQLEQKTQELENAQKNQTERHTLQEEKERLEKKLTEKEQMLENILRQTRQENLEHTRQNNQLKSELVKLQKDNEALAKVQEKQSKVVQENSLLSNENKELHKTNKALMSELTMLRDKLGSTESRLQSTERDLKQRTQERDQIQAMAQEKVQSVIENAKNWEKEQKRIFFESNQELRDKYEKTLQELDKKSDQVQWASMFFKDSYDEKKKDLEKEKKRFFQEQQKLLKEQQRIFIAEQQRILDAQQKRFVEFYQTLAPYVVPVPVQVPFLPVQGGPISLAPPLIYRAENTSHPYIQPPPVSFGSPLAVFLQKLAEDLITKPLPPAKWLISSDDLVKLENWQTSADDPASLIHKALLYALSKEEEEEKKKKNLSVAVKSLQDILTEKPQLLQADPKHESPVLFARNVFLLWAGTLYFQAHAKRTPENTSVTNILPWLERVNLLVILCHCSNRLELTEKSAVILELIEKSAVIQWVTGIKTALKNALNYKQYPDWLTQHQPSTSSPSFVS